MKVFPLASLVLWPLFLLAAALPAAARPMPILEGAIEVSAEKTVVFVKLPAVQDGVMEKTALVAIVFHGEAKENTLDTKHQAVNFFPTQAVAHPPRTHNSLPAFYHTEVAGILEDFGEPSLLIVVPTIATTSIKSTRSYQIPVVLAFGTSAEKLYASINRENSRSQRTASFESGPACVFANAHINDAMSSARCPEALLLDRDLIITNKTAIMHSENPALMHTVDQKYGIVGYMSVTLSLLALFCQNPLPKSMTYGHTNGMFVAICVIATAFVYRALRQPETRASLTASFSIHTALFGGERDSSLFQAPEPHVFIALACVTTACCMFASIPWKSDTTRMTEFVKRGCASTMAGLCESTRRIAIVTSSQQSAGAYLVVFLIEFGGVCLTLGASVCMIIRVFKIKNAKTSAKKENVRVFVSAVLCCIASIAMFILSVAKGMFRGAHIFFLEQGLSLIIANFLYVCTILFALSVVYNRYRVIYRCYKKQDAAHAHEH
jgi:hypothetical protein